MDTRILFALKQGSRSLENHIREFLACAHYSDFTSDIFCDGINQPLRSPLRREGSRSSLSSFLDFALLTVGSLFTVGVADKDRDTASRTEMVDAPEYVHKMAATPEPAPSQELAESAPEPAPSQELAESAPEPAPSQELAESAPEPAPSQELAESAPEPAPSQELAESAPEPSPSQELAESAPEPAPSQKLAESAPEPAPSQDSPSQRRVFLSESAESLPLRWFRPAPQSPCWFRPAPQNPCWPRPAHLLLRWFLPVQRLPSAPETQHVQNTP